MTGRSVDSVFTEYAKVTESHLVQLEIHVLGDSEKDGTDAVAWFNKRTHVKEITAALMPVMRSRVNCLCERKSKKCLRKETETFHVDAPSLRLSYCFCKRSHSNDCVIISCTERNLRSRRRRSLQMFSEKLVVHAYHREGFSRMEAIHTTANRELLNFKYETSDPRPSGPAQSGTAASGYFDKHYTRPPQHQQTLREIVKKSGPKLSKLRRPRGMAETDSVVSVESVESVWSMEDEGDKGYKMSPAESVPEVPDTLEDPLTVIEDTGLYQREAVSDLDSEPMRGSESSCFLRCTSSDSVKTGNSKVASVCSTDEVSSGHEESGQDARHSQTRSVAPSVAGQQKDRDKSSELNRQMKNHSERDTGNWKCTRDVSEVKDKCHKDKLPKDKCQMEKFQKNKFSKDKCSKEKFPKDELTKDKYPEDNCCKEEFPSDEFPKDMCPNDKCFKEKVECHKDKCSKDTSPMEKSPKEKCHKDKTHKGKSLKDKHQNDKDKSPMEKSLMDKYPKDKSLMDKSPKEQRIPLRSKRGRSAEGSVLSDSEPVRTSRSGTREQRKLRLKRRVTPSTPPEPASVPLTPPSTPPVPVPAESSDCDVQTVDSGSPAWKISDVEGEGSTTSPGTRGAKWTKPVERQGRSGCRQSTRCGGATSPVSQRPVDVAPVPGVSPNVTKKGVAVVTTRRVTAKDTKKTSSLLMRRRRSKPLKVSSKLEEVFQDLEADFSNENTSKPKNSKQLGKKPAIKKTSAKLETILKEMEEEDVYVDSTDICKRSTAKPAKRTRIAEGSNSYLITERNSLDRDPFQGPAEMCASNPDVKAKKRKLSGDVTEVSCKPKRCKLSDRDSRHTVDDCKSPLLDNNCVSPSELTTKKSGQCSVSDDERSTTCQSVSQSLSPVLGSQKMLHLHISCDSDSSVSTGKSHTLGTKHLSLGKMTMALDRERMSDSDSCQSVSPSKSQLPGTCPSPSKIRKKLDKLRSSDHDCSDSSISPSKSPLQESECVSPSNLRKKKILKPQTSKNCLVDGLQGLPLNRTDKDNKRSLPASPKNGTKVNSFVKKTKSDTYRMSPERRKRLADLMSSDSDYESFLANGNSRSVSSRKSGSMGRVNLYFQRAMRYETRSRSQEKGPDKDDENAENVLIKDLLGDCFTDETKSKPVSVEILDKGQERINAEITQIKNVCDLTEEQLLYLVKKNIQYLKNIFEGKVPCQRHDDYKEGGKTRIALNYQVRLNLFSEEQPDIVVSALVAIFCKKTGSKYLDYVLKVLLPETLIKVYMDLTGASYRDTEEAMAQARPLEQDF